MAKEEEVYVLSEDSMVRLWLTEKLASGRMTQAQADKFWSDYGRGGSRFLASYFAAAGDIATLTKLAHDLGTPLGRVYFKRYGGKLHVVFKGRPGLRKVLTGTKYSVKNAKVVKFGIGKAGVKAASKGGAFISIFLLTAWNIADYVLNDRATLGQLLGTIATDITKVAVSAGVGAMAGAAAVGTVIGTFALGPLIVAVAVGIGVAVVLDALDAKYKWTESLSKAIDEYSEKARQAAERAKQGAIDRFEDGVRNLANGLIDLAVDSLSRYARRKVDELWRRMPLPRL